MSQRVARAERLFELRAQPLDFLRADVVRLRAEGAVDLFDGLRQRRMRLRRVGDRRLRLLAAQLEFEQPALSRDRRWRCSALERADFGERCRQLDGRLARPLAVRGARIDDGRDRRQAHEVARRGRQVGEFARLVRGVRHRRRQVKAHRRAEPQREGAVVELDRLAFLRAARQEADAAHRAGRRRRAARKKLRGEPPPMRGACPARASAYATAPRATATSGLRVVRAGERLAAPGAERVGEAARRAARRETRRR